VKNPGVNLNFRKEKRKAMTTKRRKKGSHPGKRPLKSKQPRAGRSWKRKATEEA